MFPDCVPSLFINKNKKTVNFWVLTGHHWTKKKDRNVKSPLSPPFCCHVDVIRDNYFSSKDFIFWSNTTKTLFIYCYPQETRNREGYTAYMSVRFWFYKTVTSFTQSINFLKGSPQHTKSIYAKEALRFLAPPLILLVPDFSESIDRWFATKFLL